jgi:CRP/FNR family nitrogen fixation transcriptional regulator
MNGNLTADAGPWRHERAAIGRSARDTLGSLETPTEYQRGQEIYDQETPVEFWYRIVSGTASRFAVRLDGRRQIIDLLLPGDVFGLGMGGRHQFAAAASSASAIVIRYPVGRLHLLAATDPQVAQAIREMACEVTSRLQALILILGRITAQEKVGAFLLKLAERLRDAGDELVLPVSREEIADHLALSVETVSRSLTCLKQRGAIRFMGTRRIRILDRQALDDGIGKAEIAPTPYCTELLRPNGRYAEPARSFEDVIRPRGQLATGVLARAKL